ncbi:hypothetical protein CASFOL_018583 [Castilleja foliolosa]|uniref:Nudix hydrolase domain-containing protein n=1 Tax=Castilleja foliolosa TaxID=1961234 RepID=A0ABD3D552_9LAMI
MRMNWDKVKTIFLPTEKPMNLDACAPLIATLPLELLAVLEKHGRLKGTGVWKIPTGVLEEGEDIFSGAIREVKEETGIDTEFIDVVAFRWMPISEYAAQHFAKEHSVFKYAADFCLAKVDIGYTGFTPLPISSYSIMRVLLFVARPRTLVLGNIPDTKVYRNVDHYENANNVPEILILEIDSPIYFANSNYLRERFSRWIDDEEEKIKSSG